MKNFSADWLARLNAQHSGGIFFLAAVLTVGPEDIRRYADVQRTIEFDGESYLPLPMRLEGLGQSAQQSLPAVRVTVAAVTGEVEAFLATTDILGHDVVLQILHLDLLDDVQMQDSIALQVMAAEWNHLTATFTLGINLALSDLLPRHVLTADFAPGVPEGYRRASVL